MLQAICLHNKFPKILKFLPKKILLKLRQSSLPDYSRKNSTIMKRLNRVSDYTLVKQPISFHTNYDFALQPASYKTKRTETRTDKDITTTLTWKHKITQAVNVTIHCFFFYISEELITQQEVAYPLEKQEVTPKNKTKKKKSQDKTMKGKTKRCSCCLRNQFESQLIS